MKLDEIGGDTPANEPADGGDSGDGSEGGDSGSE